MSELQNIITGLDGEVAEMEQLIGDGASSRLTTEKLKRLRGRVGSARIWLIALESYGLALQLAGQYISIGMRANDRHMRGRVDDFINTYDEEVPAKAA